MSIELRGTLAPKPEKPDFHLDQLGSGTVNHLLSLDLANKTEAQKPLIEFLRAMGVSDQKLAESNVVTTMRDQKSFAEKVENHGSPTIHETGI